MRHKADVERMMRTESSNAEQATRTRLLLEEHEHLTARFRIDRHNGVSLQPSNSMLKIAPCNAGGNDITIAVNAGCTDVQQRAFR